MITRKWNQTTCGGVKVVRNWRHRWLVSEERATRLRCPGKSFAFQFLTVELALILFASNAPAQTPPATDFQQWTQVAATFRLGPKLTITTFGEVHIGNDVSQFDQELMSAGVTYSPSKWVSFGTGYLFLHANPKLSGIDREHRIYGEITFSAPAFHKFLLSDRVRPELRWEELPAGGTFTQRYRNRVTVQRPVNIREKEYAPFLMWEKFYNANVGAWSRTRYYAGATLPVDGRTSVQLYFMRQNDQFARPFHKSAIGASFMFHFRGVRPSHPHE
jgi:hypothetical protein